MDIFHNCEENLGAADIRYIDKEWYAIIRWSDRVCKPIAFCPFCGWKLDEDWIIRYNRGMIDT